MIYIITIAYIIAIKITYTSMINTAKASLFKESTQQMLILLINTSLYVYILYLLKQWKKIKKLKELYARYFLGVVDG